MKNLKAALNRAVAELNHLVNPRLESELLLAHVLDQDRSYINAHPEVQLDSIQQKRFETLIKRASRLEPLAYLTGSKDFYNHSFLVNKHVLIPRPETEELVELAMQHIEQKQLKKVLDIGTGSGAIALSLAAESALPLEITAIDASLNAIKVAEINRIRIPTRHRDTTVDLKTSSLQRFISPRSYQLIVTNPPYIPTAEVDELDPAVNRYEPRLALDGGADGLKVYREIAARLPQLLVAGGICICEIHSPLAIETAELFTQNCPGSTVTIHKDLRGRMRLLEITLAQQS